MVESTINERITDKAVHVKGLALKAGISRNNNLYDQQWLGMYQTKLLNAPVYIEHIRANNAIGKVTNTELKGDELFYEADIYDDVIGEQIRKGLISNVSIGFDYKTIEQINGYKYYPDVFNPELSLVAVPGVRSANIIAESVLENHVIESTGNLEINTTVEPFGGYTDFDDCVSKNSDKADPKAYCATIMHKVEDASVAEAVELEKKDNRIKELEEAYAKVTKTNEELKKDMDTRIKEAKKEGYNEVINELEKQIPHEAIVYKWNMGSKRFVQDIKKVIYKAKESVQSWE